MEIENVLSLFDGISCGQLALQRAGINYNTYYASEVCPYAIKIAKKNFKKTVHLGKVEKIKGSNFAWIDLLIGGSPCQGFSYAGTGLNFEDPRSKLFFEFVRILKEIREYNPEVKFLLENVKMKKEHEQTISKFLGVKPIRLNSSIVSAQNRKRLYWTNISVTVAPSNKNILVKDILQPKDHVSKKYYISEERLKTYISFQKKVNNRGFGFTIQQPKEKSSPLVCKSDNRSPFLIIIDRSGKDRAQQNKSSCLTIGGNGSGNHSDMDLLYLGDSVRRYTPIECERLQTLPDDYTAGISDSQRFKVIGLGWTVDIITHLFKFLK